MISLTFTEQVKIVLKRKRMTIKKLAEVIEAETGMKMSRQNLTQRLMRDNFTEQDMRMIAEVLGCRFELSILGSQEENGRVLEERIKVVAKEQETIKTHIKSVQDTSIEEIKEEIIEETKEEEASSERDITIGEYADMMSASSEELDSWVEEMVVDRPELQKPKNKKAVGDIIKEYIKKPKVLGRGKVQEPNVRELKVDEKDKYDDGIIDELLVKTYDDSGEEASSEDSSKENLEASSPVEEILGDINPYTGQEYLTNSVRIHPKRIGYVQVYDQGDHRWTDMTEWAFLGYQERKKALLGKEYEPPVYLD